jgi:hypothetical protein
LPHPIAKYACITILSAGCSLFLTAPGAAQTHSQPPVVTPAVECASLTAADLSAAVGASAKVLSADTVRGDNAPDYCKVKINIEDFIDFEVHLPAVDWSERLLFSANGYRPPTGMGAWAVTTWSDLGHRGHEEVFATNYEYRVDYGYRSMHLIVTGSKALIEKYYHRGPRYTYYAGCSEPARESMVDLERYPNDYDGVVAGCAPMPMTVNNGIYNTWNIVQNSRPDGSSILTDDKLPIIHQAVLNQCDAADGVKDGLISDPFNCHPDLTVIQCKEGQDPSGCLTAEQVRVTNEVYRSAHDDQGNQLVPQGPLPGSEYAWAGLIAGTSHMAANYQEARIGTAKAVRDLFSDPPLPDTLQLSDIKFDRTSFDALTKLHYLYDGTDPDLSAFAKAGHKLILWHGLADVMVPPAYSLNYYAALEKSMEKAALEHSIRFYLFPGVYHCGGGQGPFPTDLLAPLTQWVEQGIAPGAVLAVHYPQALRYSGPGSIQQTGKSGTPDLTRPVYPFPYTAKYKGTGDINDAANYEQGPPMKTPASIYNWLGASLYTSGYEKWCKGTGTTFECKSKP